jgi:hypothetical protein
MLSHRLFDRNFWALNGPRQLPLILLEEVKRWEVDGFRCVLFRDAVSSLCGLVVRVPGYRSRGPGFDSRRYQIF